MQAYWLKFTDGSAACCEGVSAYDAQLIAEKLSGKVVEGGPFGADKNPNIKTLPYPASPCIWQHNHPVHGETPRFCYRPAQCAGSTSCPQRRSCCD